MAEGDDGGDGRPDEGAAGDGCGDSTVGGAEAAAPRRGTWPDDAYMTSQA